MRKNDWKVVLVAVMLFVFAASANANAESTKEHSLVKIDGVYFYGYDGFDFANIRDKFPLQTGSEVDEEGWFHEKDNYSEAVAKIVGKPATDVALVQFNKGHIIFVGIPGKSNSEPPSFIEVGIKRVPPSKKLLDKYNEMMTGVVKLVSTQSQEDRDAYFKAKGELVKIAESERNTLIPALSSSDALDRATAAYALGLVARDKEELVALIKCSRDPNSTVRNNSTRELGELLESHPELAAEISSSHYIEMLNSPTWTDRNKAVYILTGLTKSRDANVLAAMKEKALPSLKEMCLWPAAYAGSAIELLGRIAGIPDDKLSNLIKENNSSAVLKVLSAN